MIYIYKLDNTVPKSEGSVRYAVYRLGQKGTWQEFYGAKSGQQLATQLGNAMLVTANYWNELKAKHA